MTSFWEDLARRAEELNSHWSSYTLLGSFALYVLGYLTLRFHLTALGIGADLSVLDERYLFTGARFLVYLISSVPSLLLLIALIATPIWLLFSILSWIVGARLRSFIYKQWANVLSWWMIPNRLALTGILFALLMIQLVMRQCFQLNNLLLAENLPADPSWLRSLLVAPTDGPMALYFSALLAGVAVSAVIFFALKHRADTTGNALLLNSLLGFLLGVQLLLIPVNYGILIVDKAMPQVSGLEKPGNLQPNEQAWLVWEGNEGKTFLLRKQQTGTYIKSLITLPRETIKNLEIIGYDRIFEVLFGTTQS
jgi:hypothetical protein